MYVQMASFFYFDNSSMCSFWLKTTYPAVAAGPYNEDRAALEDVFPRLQDMTSTDRADWVTKWLLAEGAKVGDIVTVNTQYYVLTHIGLVQMETHGGRLIVPVLLTDEFPPDHWSYAPDDFPPLLFQLGNEYSRAIDDALQIDECGVYKHTVLAIKGIPRRITLCATSKGAFSSAATALWMTRSNCLIGISQS